MISISTGSISGHIICNKPDEYRDKIPSYLKIYSRPTLSQSWNAKPNLAVCFIQHVVIGKTVLRLSVDPFYSPGSHQISKLSLNTHTSQVHGVMTVST